MNLPEFLIEKLTNQYGEDIKNQIIEGYSKKRFTTFRVNTIKATVEEIEEVLKQKEISFDKVSWSKDVFIL